MKHAARRGATTSRLILDEPVGPALLAQLEEREHQVVLRLKMAVERRLGDPCLSDDLVDPDVANAASRAQRQSFDAQPTDRAGLEAFIRSYLSPEHRDHRADGCPSAALLDEIGRRPERTRQVFTDELMGVIDDIASRLDPTHVDAARTDALTLFGLMVGTLQLASALADRDLSDNSSPRTWRRR